jgi:uncharacterized membrane protein YhaH (DUF805 family)
VRYDSQMRDLLSRLSPWGRTTKSHYWLIILASALLSLGAMSAKGVVGIGIVVAVAVAVELIILVATMRRLHDAGRSQWWAILFFFPMDITVDLLTVHVSAGTWDVLNILPIQLGEANWHFIDVRTVITLIPVFIGLLAPSRPASDKTAPQAGALAV